MFTGIVEEIGEVCAKKPAGLVVAAGDVLGDMKLGDSVAVNGVCLTVTGFDAGSFSVDVMLETLERTNLGLLGVGDRVNLERPLAMGGRLGGHLVQGHIDGTGRIASVRREGDSLLMRFEASSQVMRYVVDKGFIAVDGVSLTVVSRDASSFLVSVVGYTRSHTILGNRRVSELVNLEVDIIAKYVEQLSEAVQHSNVTAGFLQEHGFSVS